jgi:hypothetical protein
MTGGTMAKAVDEIGAAVPNRRLLGMGLEWLAIEKQQVPPEQQQQLGAIGAARSVRPSCFPS